MAGQPQQLTLAFPSVPGWAQPGMASPGIPEAPASASTAGVVTQRNRPSRAGTGPRSQPGAGNAAPGRQPQPVTGGAARPRAAASRAIWKAAYGAAPAAAGIAVPAPRQHPAVSRRVPLRVIWHGTAAAAVNATSAEPVNFSIRTARRLWSAVTARNSHGGGMVLTQPAVSTEPVQVLIQAIQGGVTYNPASDPVAFAFVATPQTGIPAAPAASSGAWTAASWETDTGPQYWASMLIGPQGGTVSLAAGSWQVFVKIGDAPSSATPILPGPVLFIT